jgi:16S rRNA A1518/A1519 N6-dimethyltransferase RsmA/KsgA/DIM1 with predicted DNA glycosylase/AP lyase activity
VSVGEGRPPRPKRRFGQHFVTDPDVIEHIVAVIRPAAGQSMVEIGPGRGALTRPLLEVLGTLDVVEIDRELAAASCGSIAATRCASISRASYPRRGAGSGS